LVFPFLSVLLANVNISIRGGGKLTQVIHAPLSLPNAICQAGSNDWKYSSGWKKVWMLNAFRILKATRNNRMSCGLIVVCSLSNVRRRKPFDSARVVDESLPTFVENSEGGIDDITPKSRRECHIQLVVFGHPKHVERRDSRGHVRWFGIKSPTCT